MNSNLALILRGERNMKILTLYLNVWALSKEIMQIAKSNVSYNANGYDLRN